LLNRAATRAPKSLAVHKALARSELATGKTLDAIPHLKVALASDEDGTLHYQLAQAYRATGQIELANKMLKEYQSLQRSAAAQAEAARQDTEITAP
jgi:predicted Zn-dependent protease